MAQHTISGLDSYFGAIILDEKYIKGPASMLHREKLIRAKWPVGIAFMSRPNIRAMMRQLRARVGDCTLSLFDMFPILKTTYYRYFSTMNEPEMPQEQVAKAVEVMNGVALEKLVESRKLYSAARNAFLKAISGRNPVEQRPVQTRTTDKTLYASPPELAPCFTTGNCVDGKYTVGGRALQYPPAGGTKIFQPRPNWKGKRRARLD